MSAAARFSVRQEGVQLIERGRDSVLQAALYVDGTLTAPTAASTISIYDATNTAVVDAVAVTTVAASVAEYTVPAATTASLSLGAGWRIEWTLVVTGEPSNVVLSQEAALVRYRLRPVITDLDVGRRVPALDTASAVRITTDTHYQAYIDEADVEIQARLLAQGRRPWLIASPSALRQVWLYLTISLIFEAVHDHRPTDGYLDSIQRYRAMYERAWSEARATFDWDEDGDGDSLERTGMKPGVVWLA